jgi:hypothetical protein
MHHEKKLDISHYTDLVLSVNLQGSVKQPMQLYCHWPMFILCGVYVWWGVVTIWLPGHTIELNTWNAARDKCGWPQKKTQYFCRLLSNENRCAQGKSLLIPSLTEIIYYVINIKQISSDPGRSKHVVFKNIGIIWYNNNNPPALFHVRKVLGDYLEPR